MLVVLGYFLCSLSHSIAISSFSRDSVELIPLQSYNISGITVSGISSGGYMAVQTHIAHSSIINGAAVFAGGPFYCAESNLIDAEERCMDVSLGLPRVAELVAATLDYAFYGFIDSTKYLADDHVYLFSGQDDSVVDPLVVKSLHDFYVSFMTFDQITADYNVAAEHCLPTLDYGVPCSQLASPYIGDCKFDGAGRAFEALYGKSNLNDRGIAINSNLQAFSQLPYISSYVPLTSLDSIGYIYVPTKCASKDIACELHISFHGCEMNLDLIGNQYAADTGFNEWAESNNIIVLYPYVDVSRVLPYNPNGCWDWWAYTGVDYGLKSGKQMKFVRSMIDQLTGRY